MDMLVPKAIEPPCADQLDKLVTIAKLLGCSVETFFRPAAPPSAAETAKLIQLWTKITEPQDRQVVFRCIDEVLMARNGY